MKPFDLDIDAHYLRNAYHLAVMSRLAYSDDPAGVDCGLGSAFDSVEPIDTGKTEGFLAGNGRHVVIVFRGTNNTKDWLRNLDTIQVAGYGGHVHQGFHIALMEAWVTVLKKLARLRTSGQLLWIAGHSLGGALATLAARRLELDQGERPSAVFTYGAPRVFDPSAARRFRAVLYRFVNRTDIVPHVPPPLLLLRQFKHVGKFVHLLEDGVVDTAEAEWNKMKAASIDFMTSATEKDFIGPLEDHKIERYIEQIARAVEQLKPVVKRGRVTISSRRST
jgi:triacylglycerol lipase